MVKLGEAFTHFGPFKVLVIGDFLLDTYTTGRVKRISPEAPVPVMEVLKQESRPGGAGNVVLNLTALGATVYAAGRIGNDDQGDELKKRLSPADTSCLLIEPSYKTPVKNRLIAESQQLIRVDFETICPLQEELEERMLVKLETVIPEMNIVAISDYGKGFLSKRLIQFTLQTAKKCGIPSVVDPKGIDFQKYRGATVLKPNLSEAYAAAKCSSSHSLDEVASELRSIAEILLVTRSEAGISIFEKEGQRSDFPVRSKEVKDVTGAGDTVLSTICLGLANGLNIQQAAELANLAAGLAIERLGCAQITLSELARRLLEHDCNSKIFDESHTFALKAVLKGKKYSLLVLEKGQRMSHGLFKAIRYFSEKKDEELLIYVRDTHPDDELIHLLSSLHEVDYIILQTESLKNLCSAIHPHEVYLLEQDQPMQIDLAKDLLGTLIKQFA